VDLAASTDYYTRVLGMAVDFTAPGWTFLSRGSFRLMLGECADTAPAHETADHSYFAYVTVEGIDQFYTEVLGNGASLMQGLADKPWGDARVRRTHPGRAPDYVRPGTLSRPRPNNGTNSTSNTLPVIKSNLAGG
jgi:catechol 2,3-dioxygenase-like lactoylglutathione lyase family enzyme